MIEHKTSFFQCAKCRMLVLVLPNGSLNFRIHRDSCIGPGDTSFSDKKETIQTEKYIIYRYG